MNNHRMCKMVFDTLSKSSIDKTTLQKADRVTFEYYCGRYELHHLQFRNARRHLLYCFENCHVKAIKQRRYLSLYPLRFPIFCFSTISLLSTVFIYLHVSYFSTTLLKSQSLTAD